MPSAKRTARLEEEHAKLALAYRDALLMALRQCRAGHWGVFKQNSEIDLGRYSPATPPKSVIELEQVGLELARVREQLGLPEPFEPARRLEDLRSLDRENAPGEPRLAELFLRQLERPGEVTT